MKTKSRSSLRVLSAVLLAAAVLAPSTPGPARALPAVGLREIAQRNNVYVGTMLWGVYRNEHADMNLMRTVCTEFNMLSTGNALKFEVVHPEENRYNWVPSEKLWAIANACGMRFVATPLVWHQQIPGWVLAYDGKPARLRQILKEHVTKVVRHFAGRVAIWDIVNEALESDGQLKDQFWVRNLGPGYIEDAYRWARAADPMAKLYYNEYSSDGMGRKGNGVYRWVKHWLSRGVPIDGVGIQAHGPVESRSSADLVANMRRLARLGLETRLSEIALPIGPGTYADRRHQAAMYHALASACFSPGTGCRTFTVWGVTDRDYRPVFVWRKSCCGLLFDETFQPKNAYFALADALSNASR